MISSRLDMPVVATGKMCVPDTHDVASRCGAMDWIRQFPLMQARRVAMHLEDARTSSGVGQVRGAPMATIRSVCRLRQHAAYPLNPLVSQIRARRPSELSRIDQSVLPTTSSFRRNRESSDSALPADRPAILFSLGWATCSAHNRVCTGPGTNAFQRSRPSERDIEN